MFIRDACVAIMLVVGLVMVVHAQADVKPLEEWQVLMQEAISLSRAARNAAQYDSIVVLIKRAREVAERAYGAEDTSVAKVDDRLGGLHYYQANYDEAETVWRRALAIRETALGPEHPDVAYSLTRVADLYVRKGHFEDAKILYQRALQIQEKVLGATHPDVATTLHSMAVLSHVQGRYAEAETLYGRALEIQEKALGADHPDVALSLVGLAYVCYEQGRFTDAEPLFQRALYIREKVTRELAAGRENSNVAATLNHLANLYGKQGRYAEAEPLYRRALRIFELVYGVEHPHVGWSLTCLADFYASQGRYPDAEPLYRRAIQIQEHALGPEHPWIAGCLLGLANVTESQGCYTDAEPLYLRALKIREESLGLEHPDVAEALAGVALNAHDKGQFVEAEAAESRAWKIRSKNFRDGVRVLSEQNALEYSQLLERESADYISILLDSPDGQVRNRMEISDVALESKSQVSDGILARSHALETESDSTSIQLTDALRQARFFMAKLYVDGPGEQGAEIYSGRLAQAVREKERIETELSRRSANFRRDQRLWNAKTDDIVAALPDGTALVEYLLYDHRLSLGESEQRFLAIVLRRGFGPSIVELGPAEPIEAAVTWYRSHFDNFASQNPAEYDEISRDLYQLIWSPLDSLVRNHDAVFIGPDGELNLIAFAGLKRPDGKYLVEEFAVHYLATGRDLIRLSSEPQNDSTVLLAFGDPAYDASVEERCRDSENNSEGETTGLAAGGARRNARSGCEAFQERNWNRLAATRDEVTQLAAIWSARGITTTVYTGAQASEERFKREAQGKRIIHLATHGFFVGEECRGKLTGHSHAVVAAGENPMLQSGFVLAGANLRFSWSDSTNLEDGIVTAEEVAGLELHTTDLVVLSACETGLGNIKAGEGVFGLRRAFQLAGARTIISTLWQVEDQDAADLASGLLEAGYPLTSESVRAATLKRLWARRAAGLSDHPYYWAGFIVTGDWK